MSTVSIDVYVKLLYARQSKALDSTRTPHKGEASCLHCLHTQGNVFSVLSPRFSDKCTEAQRVKGRAVHCIEDNPS